MKMELVFFDDKYQSIEGTKRALIAFITLIICNLFIFRDPKIIESLLLSSAIGVGLPKSLNEGLIYSFLVGLVVFGSCYNGFFIFNLLKTILAGAFVYYMKYY
jgi:hypothetical protein